jgi:hypothetical protein
LSKSGTYMGFKLENVELVVNVSCSSM